MMPVAPLVAAAAFEYAATGDLGTTSEHPVVQPLVVWSPSVSPEGIAVAERVHRFMRTIETGDAIVAAPSARRAIRLASPVPSTWLGFAQTLFPNSRPMTGDERRAFDASAWSALEAIDIVDD